LAGFPGKDFKVICPFHVEHGSILSLDPSLINPLLKASASTDFEKYELAIFNFNNANTDSDLVSPFIEMVLTCSAFERLYKIENSKESSLAKMFLGDLYFQGEQKNPPKREVWIRDFYQSRNQFAHGKKMVLKKSIWSIQEHLLLGAFIFPIIVKINLQQDGLCTLDDDDKYRIYFFDHLIKCSNLFREINYESKWNRIRFQTGLKWIWDRRKEELKTKSE
jgi:hypothetical protein